MTVWAVFELRVLEAIPNIESLLGVFDTELAAVKAAVLMQSKIYEVKEIEVGD